MKQPKQYLQVLARLSFSSLSFRVILCITVLLITTTKIHATNYAWNGSVSSVWRNASNWTPAGIPGVNDTATITAAVNQPVLDTVIDIRAMTLNTGRVLDLNTFNLNIATFATINAGSTIDIHGATLTVSGNATFNGGTYTNSGLTGSIITLGTTTTFGNGAGGPTITAEVNVTSATVTLRNTVFNKKLQVNKTGSSNDNSTGNNIYNDTAVFSNSGTGYLVLSNVTKDVFNGDAYFRNTGPSAIYPGHVDATGTVFNGDIYVGSTAGTGVLFANTTGAVRQAAGKHIYIDALGFSAGTLSFKSFTQLGADDIAFTLTGTAAITFASGSTILGNVNVTAPSVNLNGCTFNGTVDLTKSGSGTNTSTGGNTFVSTLTLTNAGSGTIALGSTTGDTFNSTVNFNNTGSGTFHIAYSSAANVFNAPVIISNNGSGTLTQITVADNSAAARAIFNSTVTVNNGGAATNSIVRFSRLGQTSFNDDVTVSSTTSTSLTYGIYFGSSATAGTTVLAAGKSVFIGAGGFSKGSLGFYRFTQTGTTAQSYIATGTARIIYGAGSVFNADVTSSSPQLLFNGTTFHGTVTATKTSSGNDQGTGANVFNGVANITNTGTGYLMFGNTGADTFNADVTFNNNGTSAIYLAHVGAGTVFNGVTTINNNGSGASLNFYICDGNAASSVTFNGPLIINNTGTATTGYVRFAYRGTVSFNDDIIVSSTMGTSANGIYFFYSGGTGSCSLANGKTVTVGGSGYSKGVLVFGRFTQTGTTPLSLTLTGTASLYFSALSTFNADINVTAPDLYFNGTTMNGNVTGIRSGTASITSNGGNTFNGTLTLSNTLNGNITLSNVTGDIYNGDLDLTNNGTGIIYVAHNDAAGTQFNGNVIVSNTGTGSIRIGQGTGTSALASGKLITIGAGGFASGALYLSRFTQTGNDALSLSIPGASTVLVVSGNSVFNGDLTMAAADIYFNGITANGTVTAVRTGSGGINSNGNNTFNNSFTFRNSGNGNIVFSNTTKDTYNGPVSLTNAGTGILYMAHNDATGTLFNDNIEVNNLSTGSVRFGQGTGTSTLATGKTISIGSGGFAAGALYLSKFTQTGSTAQNINIPAGTASVLLGAASTFNGDVTINVPDISFNGTTFNGNVTTTRFGTTTITSNGNNIFNGSLDFINSANGTITFSNATRDTYNGNVTLTNNGTGIIYMAQADAAGTQFNGNIVLNNTSTGSIRFGQGTGTSTLATGKTISIGGSGFASGALYLNKFTQTGTTSQIINLAAGTAAFYLGTGTVFNGDVNFQVPQVYLNGATYNNTTYIEKKGATGNTSNGANTFNGITTIKNSSAANLILANATGDTYNNDVTFVQTGAGILYPAYNGTNIYTRDVSTAGSSAIITFGASAGTNTFSGSSVQTINGSASFAPVFRRMTVNNASGIVLGVPVTSSVSLTLTNGVVTTTSTNLLSIDNTFSTVTNVSASSYVDGPVKKTGNAAFTFPVGKGGSYRPISIAAPGAATDQFQAEYFHSDPGATYLPSSLDVTLDHIGRCEYWNLTRPVGASSVNVTLSWDNNSCGITQLSALRVARWDAVLTRWRDQGNGSTTGTTTAGTIITSPAVGTFTVFTLGSNSPSNPLPVQLINFTASRNREDADVKWVTASESGSSYFTLERMTDGVNFNSIYTCDAAGFSSHNIAYSYADKNVPDGTVYYRLKQVDKNGKFKYYGPVKLTGTKDINPKLEAGPVPFDNELNIMSKSITDADCMLRLYGADGSLVTQENVFAGPDGLNCRITLDNNLTAGIYFLQVTAGDVIINRKVLKK